MDIYTARPEEGRKWMDFFSLRKIPADISEEVRTALEELLLNTSCGQNQEVYIITEGYDNLGNLNIFCFVKDQEDDMTGILLLITFGESPQILKIANCYNEGELLYSQAEWYPGNILSYYDYFIVRGEYSRVLICPNGDNEWVQVRIPADQREILDEPRYMRRNGWR